MQTESPPQDDQAALWNGIAGRAWVDGQDLLDRLFAPFERLLVEAIAACPARDVLDIGCGTGSTTAAIARALGGEGRCTGVDISAPMIGAARARADWEGVPASFVLADAQTHNFAGRFDRIVSRFGVMFFADPVAAFANLRRAARSDATLDLIVWRSAADNPFMTVAERAAAPLLPDVPVRKPDEPGQFGFADPDRVRAILERGGWRQTAFRPLDIACTMPEAELVRYFTRLGPLGRVLDQADASSREQVVETVRAAFDPYVEQDEVRFTAACWRVEGRAG